MLKTFRKRRKERKLKKPRLICLAAAVLALLSGWGGPVPTAYAMDIFTDTTTSTNIFDGLNWVYVPATWTITGGYVFGYTYNGGTMTVSGGTVSWITQNDGTMTITGGTVSGDIDSISTLNVSGGMVSGVTDNWAGTMTVSGGAISGATYNRGTLNVTGGMVSGPIYNWTNGILNVSGGTVGEIFNLFGAMTVSGGNIGSVTNDAGRTLDMSGGTISGLITNRGTMTITGGRVSGDINSLSTLNISGGTISGLVTNNGTLNVSGGRFILASGSATGRSIAITNLSGAAGFALNTNLNAGTSDLVTVTTTASGSHTLSVTNVGGAGSPGRIVRVVDLPGGSTATFSGGGDSGAYYYAVARGSALTGYGVLNGEDYYYYNTSQPSAVSKAAISIGAGAVAAWYGEMNEIRKRMGDLRMGSQSSDDFWVRTFADKFNVNPAGADSYNLIMRGIELGKDNPQAFAGGRKYTGFVVGTGKADSTYSSSSTGTSDSIYAGAYASWLRDDGAYCDLIGKYNWFSHHFTTASDSGSYHNTGLGLSAEIGKRFEQGNGVFIEPAAELSALWAHKASYVTAGNLAVEVPAARSLQLRLGMAAGKKWKDADGASRQLYGKVSWVNEYEGDSTTRVDTASFDSSLKGRQWVTGIGFIQDTGHCQIYFDAEKSWGRSISKTWGVNAGCRFKF